MVVARMNSTAVPILLLAAALGCVGSTPSPEMERRVAGLEKEAAVLNQRVDTLTSALIEYTGDKFGLPISSTPAIDAEVLDVKRDLKIVVLNKGKKDEVKVGYIFDVYLGSTYKGQVRVQDVQENTCTGLILNEMNPIELGDSATTSL